MRKGSRAIQAIRRTTDNRLRAAVMRRVFDGHSDEAIALDLSNSDPAVGGDPWATRAKRVNVTRGFVRDTRHQFYAASRVWGTV